MSKILTMGHSLKTNSETTKKRSEKGYVDEDLPVLESFGLFKNGKPVPDFVLTNEEYSNFLNWLGNGPAKPIPAVGVKVLCFYKQKLSTGLKDYGITDGFRQKQKNLIKSIDEMLKDGDDTQNPGAICAKGGSSTPPTSDCCESIKNDITTIKSLIEELKTATATQQKTNTTGQTEQTGTQQSEELGTAIRSVASMVQHVDDKTAQILEELTHARQDIQSIMTRSAQAVTTNTTNATNATNTTNTTNTNKLQADYDQAQSDAETAREQATVATEKLKAVLSNEESTSSQIQEAIEEAIKAKSDVEKHIAVANYIYKLDASSSTNINVEQPNVISSAQQGGRRTKKTQVNLQKMQEAETKLDDLDATITTAMKKLLTKKATNQNVRGIIDSQKKALNAKSAELSQITDSLTALSGIVKELAQKAETLPESDNIKSKLEAAHKQIEELEQQTHSDEDSQKIIDELQSQIEGLKAEIEKQSGLTNIIDSQKKALNAKSAELSQITDSLTALSEIIKELVQKAEELPASNNIKTKLEFAHKRIEELEQQTLSDEDSQKIRLELESQIEGLKAEIEQKAVLHNTSLKEIQVLKSEIATYERKITTLQGETSGKTAKINALEEEINELQNTLATLRTQLETTLKTETKNELDSKIVALTQAINEKSTLYETLQTEHNKIVGDLTVAKAEIAGLRQEFATKLKNGQTEAVADLQERYDDTLREMHRAHGELYTLKEKTKNDQLALARSKEEIEKARLHCVGADTAIKEQLRKTQVDLSNLQTSLQNKEAELQTLRNKGGKNVFEKEQQLNDLRRTVEYLTRNVESCKKTAAQSQAYLQELERLKQPTTRSFPVLNQTLKNTSQKTNVKNTMKNARFERNFPGLNKTLRKTAPKTNFRSTAKLPTVTNDRFQRNFPGHKQSVQPAQTVQPVSPVSPVNSRFERNFPGHKQTVQPIQNARFQRNFPGQSGLRRINKERQDWQKTYPHTNLKGGLRKGARLAKSKRNIHPLN